MKKLEYPYMKVGLKNCDNPLLDNQQFTDIPWKWFLCYAGSKNQRFLPLQADTIHFSMQKSRIIKIECYKIIFFDQNCYNIYIQYTKKKNIASLHQVRRSLRSRQLVEQLTYFKYKAKLN